MSGPPLPQRGQTFWGVFDQALSSGGNFLILLLIAQGSSVADFGWFAVMFGVVATGLSVSRTALGVPISTELGLRNPHVPRLIGESSTLALVAGTVAAVIITPMAIVLDGAPGRWALMVAVGLPLLVLQDLWRFVAVVNGQARTAATADGLWFAVILALWIANLVDPGHVTGTEGLVGWLSGAMIALIALIAGGVAARPLRGIGPLIREPRRAHLALDALLGAVASAALPALVAVMTVPAVTGTWRGATTLMSPLNVLLAAMPLVYLRRVTELGARNALRVCQRLGAGLAALALGWGLLLFLVPAEQGAAFMGDTWGAARDLLPFAAAETACIALWTAGVTLLRARQRTGRALKWRIRYAGISLVSGVAAAAVWGTALSVAGAMAACALAIAAGLWWSLRRQIP